MAALISLAALAALAPLVEASAVGRRNLGNSQTDVNTYTPTSTPSAAPAGTSMSSNPLDSSGFTTNVVTWIGVLAGVSVIIILVLWRCMRARQLHGRATLRSMVVPQGLNIPWLHIKLDPVKPMPQRPISSYLPPPTSAGAVAASRSRARGRQSRRAARGPDIGEGGRRLGTGGGDDDGDSVYGFDELPAYGGDHRPPAYAGIWSQTTGASPPTPSALEEAGMDDSQQYEMRTRFGATTAADHVDLPARPASVRTRGPSDMRHCHRDSVTSVASTSAETIRGDEDDAQPSSPKLKRPVKMDSIDTTTSRAPQQ